jgi:hypothetical protein
LFFLRCYRIPQEQIGRWDLPTRPTKKEDTRSKTWDGDSVELDAIPLESLQDLVEGCIRRHIDLGAWEVTLQQEASDRERFSSLIDHLAKPARKPPRR